jgi:hypothetical protein
VTLSSIGLSGILQSEALAARSASSLVRSAVSGPSSDDPARDIVSLQQASSGVAIGAKVIEAGREMTKSLLDMFA